MDWSTSEQEIFVTPCIEPRQRNTEYLMAIPPKERLQCCKPQAILDPPHTKNLVPDCNTKNQHRSRRAVTIQVIRFAWFCSDDFVLCPISQKKKSHGGHAVWSSTLILSTGKIVAKPRMEVKSQVCLYCSVWCGLQMSVIVPRRTVS